MQDHDKITLHVGNYRINRFTQYSISNNLYSADSKFTFNTGKPVVPINTGDIASLKINNIPVMTAIIDKSDPKWDKNGIFFEIAGRDFMGLVNDQYVERWQTFKGKTLKHVAETLLQDVPIVSNREIRFQDGTDKLNITGDFVQPEPGQTTFEVLKIMAESRGVQFYNDPDGTFVFGKPLNRGKAEYSFAIRKINGKIKSDSKLLSGGRTKSSSKHYRYIVIVGENEEEGTSFKKDFQDDTAPIKKTLVVQRNDGTALNSYGQNLINQQRYAAFSANYQHSGHSQKGKTFLVNKMASIQDDVCEIRGNFLLYGVDYNLANKKTGPISSLRFGLPGALI